MFLLGLSGEAYQQAFHVQGRTWCSFMYKTDCRSVVAGGGPGVRYAREGQVARLEGVRVRHLPAMTLKPSSAHKGLAGACCRVFPRGLQGLRASPALGARARAIGTRHRRSYRGRAPCGGICCRYSNCQRRPCITNEGGLCRASPLGRSAAVCVGRGSSSLAGRHRVGCDDMMSMAPRRRVL